MFQEIVSLFFNKEGVCVYIFFYLYDPRDLRRSNHLLKAGLALESDTDARALCSRPFKTSKGWSLCPFGQPALLLACPHGGRKGFLYLQSELPLFQIMPVLSCSCRAPQWHPGSILSQTPSQWGTGRLPCYVLPKAISSPGWASPSPSAIPHWASAPNWDHSRWWCLSGTRGAQSCIQCLKVVSQVLNRGG